MKKKVMLSLVIIFVIVVAVTSTALVIHFNVNKTEAPEEIYKPIPEIPEAEKISMEDDPLASIQQATEHYSQFTKEELDNAKVYYDMKKAENAIFVYNYVDSDFIAELPSWVSSDVITEYSSRYEGFVMDDFMSACFQTIIKCCEKYNVDLSDINMHCTDNGSIAFTVNNSEYYLYMATDLPHEDYKYTVYVIPVEN